MADEVFDIEYAEENNVILQECSKFNWGAFLLSWIWGIGNNSYVTLITIFQPCLLFIPFLGFPSFLMVSIWLGLNGNRWALNNKQWLNIKHFRSVQKKWVIAGLIVHLLFTAFISFYIFSSAQIRQQIFLDNTSATLSPELNQITTNSNQINEQQQENQLAQIIINLINNNRIGNTNGNQQEIFRISHRAIISKLNQAFMLNQARNNESIDMSSNENAAKSMKSMMRGDIDGNSFISFDNSIYTFECQNNTSCIVTIDVNGDQQPNRLTQNEQAIYDRVQIKLVKNQNDTVTIFQPKWLNGR